MESTYGDKQHETPPDFAAALAGVLKDTFTRGGNLVIPAFSVGRTQEMLYFIREIKEKGLLAGVALNPATPLSAIEWILPKVDMVLIMSVNPGFGGQKLIPYTVEKVRALKKMIDERGLKTDIEVDGGVNLENVTEVMDAGANIIVAGSAVFKGDISENVERFLDVLKE